METASVAMSGGDCLLIERANGNFDLFELSPNGTRHPVYRNISDPHVAKRLAMAKLGPKGGDVYYKDESEPDSAIRLLRGCWRCTARLLESEDSD